MTKPKPKPKMGDNDEAIAMAAAATSNARELNTFLKSHIWVDPSGLPKPRSFNEPQSVCLLDENDLRAMSHDELVAHAIKLTDSILHAMHMSIDADRNRIAYGIQGNNRVLAVAEIATKLGAQVLKTKEGHKRGAAKKLAKDPKQAAKIEAHKLWLAWQKGETIHSNQTAFCLSVCEQLHLKDYGNVGKWCREWRES